MRRRSKLSGEVKVRRGLFIGNRLALTYEGGRMGSCVTEEVGDECLSNCDTKPVGGRRKGDENASRYLLLRAV